MRVALPCCAWEHPRGNTPGCRLSSASAFRFPGEVSSWEPSWGAQGAALGQSAGGGIPVLRDGAVQAADGCANLGLLLLLFSSLLLCPGSLWCLGTSEHSSHILFTFLLPCHGMTMLSNVLTEMANTSAPLCLTSSEFLTRNERCGLNSLDPAQAVLPGRPGR